MKIQTIQNGSVTSPKGFKACGVVAGLKRSGKPDMALLLSDTPATVAGTFTRCVFAAAPVLLDKAIVAMQQKVRGVIINSGNANACTGATGLENAQKMCVYTQEKLGLNAEEILVSSTGRIGVQMPMDTILKGIDMCCDSLSDEGGLQLSDAIITTDTRPKTIALSFELPSSGALITIGGACKGAGMIAPEMFSPGYDGLHATMLCYITTDVDAGAQELQTMLQDAVSNSFNRITVDGDMSTNDTALLFANGASGAQLLSSEDNAIFAEALRQVTDYLAKEIVYDGEGVTKFVTVKVTSARDEADARKAVNAVCNSLLCKTAWFGGDPNWGRVLAAVGYSGAQFDQLQVSMDYNDLPVVRLGQDAGTSEADLAEVLKNKEFTIHVDLAAGDASYWMYTNDISYEYVKINAEYYT